MATRRAKIISILAAVGILVIAFVIAIMQLESKPAGSDIYAKKAPGVVYESHWEGGPRNEWSIRNASSTIKGRKRFLGPFNERPLNFTIGGLPAHQLIRVQFDLITLHPWNGDSGNFGRDLWDMRVVNGQPLIHTTFSNCGFFSNNNEQSFPDQYPWYPTHPGWTGATAKQSLGYTEDWGRGPNGVDSTYHFDLTFPHSADVLQLQFKSQIKRHEDKSYGFLNFKVETVDHAPQATDAQLATWWEQLGDADPVVANSAVWSLVPQSDLAAAYIKSHIKKLDPAIPLKIDLESQWEHGSFSYDTPEQRQQARAVHVLEAIGMPAAKAILNQFGYEETPQGAPPTQWDR